MNYLCFTCGKEYKRNSFEIKRNTTNGHNNYCSTSCRNIGQTKKTVTVLCENCEKPIHRRPKTMSPHNFCSRSCAATYNNAHKTHGTRRSKIEIYIENRLRSEFPSLIIECNSKFAIGSELDIYLPQLRLAIELNGIFHYEPIYGSKTFDRIIKNDSQKLTVCYQHGIELVIIDISALKHFTERAAMKYYEIVDSVVRECIGRI